MAPPTSTLQTGSATTQSSDLTPLSTFTAQDTSSGQKVHVYPTRDVLDLPGVRESLARPSGGNMTNHGGAVQTQPKIYVVFWGASWNSSGDPNGAATYLTNFLGAAGGSAWLKTVTQYGAGNPSSLLAGTWVDTGSTPPSRPSTSQIAAEAAAAAAHFLGSSSVNANYIVAMPHGVAPSGFKTQWCAYHSTFQSGGSAVPFTALPYQPDAGYGCGAGSVSTGVLDGFSIVGGHEVAEVITDPQLDAWYDGQQEEIGDKCAWKQLELNSSVGYPTQPLWSNAISGCTQGT